MFFVYLGLVFVALLFYYIILYYVMLCYTDVPRYMQEIETKNMLENNEFAYVAGN